MRHPAELLYEPLVAEGFEPVEDVGGDAIYDVIFSRKNWKANRAVAVVSVDDWSVVDNSWFDQLRSEIAGAVGYIPLIRAVFSQVVVVGNEPMPPDFRPGDFVATIDNQWSNIQLVVGVCPHAGRVREGRTWGQFLSGDSHDRLVELLRDYYEESETVSD